MDGNEFCAIIYKIVSSSLQALEIATLDAIFEVSSINSTVIIHQQSTLSERNFVFLI